MRVCVVTTSFPRAPGDPSGHFVRTEALAAAARGEHVVVLAPGAPPHPALEVLPLPGARAFGWPGALPRLAQNPLLSLDAARWIRAARRAIAAAGPFDRIVAHWAAPCAWPVAEAGRGALEVVSHGSDVSVLARLPPPVRARVVGWLAARAAMWRFVSAPLLERFARALSPAEARAVRAVAVVRPCPIDVPDVAARARSLRDAVGEPFVSAVGRLVPSKRTEVVVAAAAAERARLVVVGDGPERRGLERAARGARVTFVGDATREDALAWMRASEALWFAGRAEGLPTVLREADALGVPVRML